MRSVQPETDQPRSERRSGSARFSPPAGSPLEDRGMNVIENSVMAEMGGVG